MVTHCRACKNSVPERALLVCTRTGTKHAVELLQGNMPEVVSDALVQAMVQEHQLRLSVLLADL